MYHSIFVYWHLIILNQRILASILLTHHENLSVLDYISSEMKHLTLKPYSVQKIQHTVSLNINVMPPNVCDISTSLKEWSDNKVFSIKMGLSLSLHSIKDTENVSQLCFSYLDSQRYWNCVVIFGIYMHVCTMFHYFNTNTVQVKKGGSWN